MDIIEYKGTNPNVVYTVTINPGRSVTVERKESGAPTAMRTFEPGDVAEYDSFNLRYTAPIKSISAKTITFDLRHGKTKRLKPEQFAWRNWNFNAAQVQFENAMTMNYI